MKLSGLSLSRAAIFAVVALLVTTIGMDVSISVDGVLPQRYPNEKAAINAESQESTTGNYPVRADIITGALEPEIERRFVPPVQGRSMRTRAAFSPDRDYLIEVVGTYSFGPNGSQLGQADAECTHRGGIDGWQPSRYLDTWGDHFDLVVRFQDGHIAVGDWTPILPVTPGSRCSSTHAYYTVVKVSDHFAHGDSYNRNYMQDLEFTVDAIGYDPQLNAYVTATASQPGLLMTIKQGSWGQSVRDTRFVSRRQDLGSNYYCGKSPYEPWNPTPTASALSPSTATVGELSSAKVIIDSRQHLHEYNLEGPRDSQGRLVKHDATPFVYWEQAGRTGISTCNWAFPGSKYNISVTGTYTYVGGETAKIRCSHLQGPDYCFNGTTFTYGSNTASSIPPSLSAGCREGVSGTATSSTYPYSQSYGTNFRISTNGFVYKQPVAFMETCDNATISQCTRTPDPAREVPGWLCIEREEDRQNDPNHNIHKGVTLAPARADAECAEAPWARTQTQQKYPDDDETWVPGWGPVIQSGRQKVDSDWRFDRVRGGGRGITDELYSRPPLPDPTSTEDQRIFDGPNIQPQREGEVGTVTGTGWYLPNGEPNRTSWSKFESSYHDRYDLYVNGVLRNWNGAGTDYDRTSWTPVGSLRADPKCSSGSEYKVDNWSPHWFGFGPQVLFLIQDYNLEFFNTGQLYVTLTRTGQRTDLAWYKDWCNVGGTWQLSANCSLTY